MYYPELLMLIFMSSQVYFPHSTDLVTRFYSWLTNMTPSQNNYFNN